LVFSSKRTYLLELIVEITLTEGNIETLGDISFTSIKEREPFPDLKLIKAVYFALATKKDPLFSFSNRTIDI
jgi:hypothetical protein